MSLLAKFRAFHESLAWQSIILHIYPTREAYSAAIEKHITACDQVFEHGKSQGYHFGYKDGHARGYNEGFVEGLNEAAECRRKVSQ